MKSRYRFTDAQRDAATQLGRSLVVTAGAGSGKTRVLVERYLNLIDPTAPGGPKATPDGVVAITFTTKAAREMLDRIREGIRERMAAAEDGRSRELWRRLYEQTACARVQTIHSFCGALLRDYPLEAGVDPEAGVLPEFTAEEAFAAAAKQAILSRLDGDPVLRTLAVERGLSGLCEEVSGLYRTIRASGRGWSEVRDMTLTEVAAEAGDEGRGGEASPATMAPGELANSLFDLLEAVDREYARAKTPAGLDFEDLQVLARNLLRDHPEVLRQLRERFRYLLVDEFQDTDALQSELVLLLAGDPPEDRLFVVGDPKQSIYRFRHAEVELFRSLREWVTARAGGLLLLAENFRSRPELVQFVNAVFGGLMGPDYEHFNPGRVSPPAMPAVELLLAGREEGENTAAGTLKEARLLAARLKAMVEGGECLVGVRGEEEGAPETRRAVRYGDIALLLRTRTYLKTFEAALAEAGIPYYVVGGIGFYRKLEVQDLLAALRAIDDPEDHLSLAAALRSPLAGLPDDALYLLADGSDLGAGLLAAAEGKVPAGLQPEAEEQLRRVAGLIARARTLRSRQSVPELLDLILLETGYEAALLAAPGGRQRVANVRKLRRVAEELTAAQCVSLTDFLAYFERLASRDKEAEAALESEAGDAVKLLTVHAAKGLEFPVVAVADLSRPFRPDKARWRFDRNRGLGLRLPGADKPLPTALAARLAEEAGEAGRAELVRLLYVAVTRAKDYLLLSGQDAPAGSGAGKEPPKCWLSWLTGALAQAGLPEGLVTTVREVAPPAPGPVRLPGMWDATTQAASAARFPLLSGVSPQRRPVAVTTVSELMCFAACPRRYHLQYRLQAPPAAGPGPGRGGRGAGAAPGLTPDVRGTLVHRAVERLRQADQLEPILEEVLAEAGLSLEDRAAAAAGIRPLLARYLAGEEFAAFARGTVLECESPFFVRLGSDLLLHGAVDRVERVPEGLRLLDFKSNLVSEAEARAEADGYYRLQLPLYALAVGRAWREPVVSAAYVFLEAEVSIEANVSPAAQAEAEEEARRLAAGMEAGEERPVASPACARCGYVPLCPAGRRTPGVR